MPWEAQHPLFKKKRMVTTKTDPHRSQIMRAVKSKDTKPELLVRRLVHSLGYRYRLHRRDLPGCPDIVFGPRRKVIFVHGCFWHGHSCKRGNRMPRSNADYWEKKISRNIERDEQAISDLTAEGWDVLVVWECEIQNKGLSDKLVGFLGH